MQKEGILYLNKDGIVACKRRDVEESCLVNEQYPEQEIFFGESGVEGNGPVEEQDLEDKILFGEIRWMSRTCRSEPTVEMCSMADSPFDNNSRISEIDTYSDRNSSTGSKLSELAIHTLLVETRARDLDRELYQYPDSNRYLVPKERVFDSTADDLETIAVSTHSNDLVPQKEAIRTDFQPFRQETKPLAKIWCVKMEDDAHQPDELSSQLRFMKTYLKARCRLSDLLRAQRNERMTSKLKRF